jgi:Peptidase A4 family
MVSRMSEHPDDRKDDKDQDSRQKRYEEVIWAEIGKRLRFALSAPDANFDPLIATPAELEKFKLPPRPDPGTSPHAFANWQRAMSPPLSFIPPDDPKKLFAVSDQGRQFQFLLSRQAATMSNNWSGGYIRDNYGEIYTRIQGSWVVPQPYPPPPPTPGGDWPPGDFVATAWLGLDGCDPGSLAMPQMGTYQEVKLAAASKNSADLQTTVNAWWQWWQKDDINGHQVDILQSAFPLNVGDVVYAELFVKDQTTVRFLLKNLSTGKMFPCFDLTQPSPVTVNPNFPVVVEGKTAEWIVERQTKAGTNDLRPFCDYGEVLFHGCTAEVTSRRTGATREQQLQLASLLRLADWTLPTPAGDYQPGLRHPGTIVSTAALQGDDGVLVAYTG